MQTLQESIDECAACEQAVAGGARALPAERRQKGSREDVMAQQRAEEQSGRALASFATAMKRSIWSSASLSCLQT